MVIFFSIRYNDKKIMNNQLVIKNSSKLMIFITVMIMDLLTGMEFDLFVPSFPEIQNQFALTPSWVEALLSVNFIGYCLSLFFLGDLSDRYGRKPIILLGMVIFTIGSILCVIPPNYAFLLIGRFLQGLGIAAPAILSFLIIADAYPIKEQQFLMAMLNGSLNIAAGFAPVIGSYVTLYLHWQGNFSVLLVMGIIVLLMTIQFIPTTIAKQQETVSLRGLDGYLALFKSKPLVLLMTTLLFIFVPYWIFVGMSPLLYMKDLGVSLAHFGYYQGILALLFAIGSLCFGLIIKNMHFKQQTLLKFGLYLLIASLLVLELATIVDTRSPLLITLAMIPFIISQIIPSTILYPICLNFIPDAKGRVSAIIQGARLVLTAIALQIAGYFYIGTFQRIGAILVFTIVIATITFYLVMQNRELMRE